MLDDNRSVSGVGYGSRAIPKKALHTLTATVGVFLLAYVLSMIVLRMDMYYAVIAALAIVGAVILSMKFEIGLLAYLFVAPFRTGDSPAVLGEQASYDVGVLPSQVMLVFLCLFWAASRLLKGRISLVSTNLNIPIAAFFAVAAMSMLSSTVIWDPEVRQYDKMFLYQVTEVGLWGLCAAAYFLTANSTSNKGWLKAFYWPIVIVAFYVSFYLIFREEYRPVVRGTFMIAFAAIMTAARLLLGTDRKIVKVGIGLILALLVVAVSWKLSWVSGWLVAALGLAAVTLFYSKKVFAALAVTAVVALILAPGLTYTVYDQSREEGDLHRIDMWMDSINMAASVNPFLGIGPADYMTYSRKYGSVWYGHNTFTNAHSDYAQMVAELGLLGILAFLWLIVAGIKTGINAYREADSDVKWFAAGGTAVFGAIAIVSLVGDYLLPSRVNGGIWSFGTSVFPWILLGASVAISRTGQEQTEGPRL